MLAGTGNPHKLGEIREILGPLGVEVVAPGDVGWTPDVPEVGETLAENALAKARAAAAASGMAALADDTGLFVDALGGAPGVRSARYAGPSQDAAANCAKLLAALREVPGPERGAAFRCVVALVTPEGGERLFEGTVRGRIVEAARGESGFGYDPLFEAEETGRTFAEMTAREKHRISHRGRALRALAGYLAGLSGKGQQ